MSSFMSFNKPNYRDSAQAAGGVNVVAPTAIDESPMDIPLVSSHAQRAAIAKSVAEALKVEKDPALNEVAVSVRGLGVTYGKEQALKGVDLDIKARGVTALIGPSGCGKSTFLRCLNRMNDYIPGCSVRGEVTLANFGSIYRENLDAVSLRSRVGMVFQAPNPFAKSIFDNVAYGPRIHGLTRNTEELNDLVESSLRGAGLWEEVRSKLAAPGTSLSGGQQQRLCIARAIAISPEIILMDEPCSALDPIATSKIEELIGRLSENYTIVIVTHSMAQARRVSQHTAFFHLGHIVESGDTEQVFGAPKNKLTQDYVMGRSG